MHCQSCGKVIPDSSPTCVDCGAVSSIEVSKQKDALRKTILEAYLNEYKDISDIWKNLETKAQGNVAIAGIFIAGVFAYIEKISPNLRSHEKFLIAASIICLVISICSSIFALAVRETTTAPLGAGTDHYGTALLALNDQDFLVRIPEFFPDMLSAWKRYRSAAKEANRSKASSLRVGQFFLIGAVSAVAILTFAKALI